MECNINIGIDVGSTTIKIVIIDLNYKVLYSSYKRHNSDIKTTFVEMFLDIKDAVHSKRWH